MCITLTHFCSLCLYVCIYISTFTSVYLATAFSLYHSYTDISVLICHLFVAHLLLGCTFLDTFTCSNPICVCVFVADVSATTTTTHKLQCAGGFDQERSQFPVNLCSRSHCFVILEEWGHFRNKMLAFRELYNCPCKLKTY